MVHALLFLLAPAILCALPYQLRFRGLNDPKALSSIQDSSDLVHLQQRPPPSLNGIRYRIENDLPQMLKVLRAYGYYDAKIRPDLQMRDERAIVTLYIYPGQQYTLGSYEILYQGCKDSAQALPCPPFSLQALGLQLGSPALSTDIVNAELNLLSELAKCGHPLASIEKRKVIVDMQTKQLEAAACIDEGPFSTFGPTSILGLKSVKPELVLRKIAWQEGEMYDMDCIEKTQKKLLSTDLFSSVLITHEESLNEEGGLPLYLRLSEAKHRQISLGAFWATVDGPGGSVIWTHRNLRGLGESLALNAEVSKRYLSGSLIYKKPDVFMEDQTLKVLGQIERQDIKAFTAFIYRAASYLDQKMSSRSHFSFGLEAQHINVSHSARNGTSNWIDLPVFAKYNTSDDALNPSKGFSLTYQPHLFQSVDHGDIHFFKQRVTICSYLPLKAPWLIFATRAQVGSILGSHQRNIPLPLLFLGGSEDDLRGYRYLTVSPLNQDDQPLGGRSAIFLTAETRFRFHKIGIVPFADFGVVSFSELPSIDEKWFKSVGIGLRYFAFFGPLRFDLAFPLDRRNIDPAFRIYVSIGQTF